MEKNILKTVPTKPLKCIVTNNTTTLEYLKNTGDLIVLDETMKQKEFVENNENEYRELYVADYFIAGGLGVRTRTEQKTLIEIVNTFKGIIGDLQNVDERLEETLIQRYDELLKKKLDITCLDENNNVILDSNGKPKQGNASKTFIEFESNNKTYYVLLSDIFKLIAGLPTYKDMEIIDVTYDVAFTDYGNVTQTLTNVKSLPINTYLSQIVVHIKLKMNSCGEIKYIKTTHITNNVSSELISEISNYTDFVTNSNTSADIDNNEINITISKTFSPGSYIIKEGDNIIFQKLELGIKETPANKYLKIDGVKDILGNDILYTENKIAEQQKEINIPSIKGEYFVGYYKTVGSTLTISSNKLNANQINTGIQYTNIISYKYGEESPKYTYINNIKNSKYIVVVLPVNFIIKDACLIGSTTEYNITNFINYYPYNTNNPTILNNIRSGIYLIKVSSGIKNANSLRLEILNNEISGTTPIEPGNNKNNVYWVKQQTTILNQEYTDKYWVDYAGPTGIIMNPPKNAHISKILNFDNI